MSNMRIWDAVSKTDPKHTKPFKRAGGFQGTAIKPIWLTKRLTEQFGPAGTGWGMDKPDHQVVVAGNEILVFCTVALWYMDGEKRATVFGVGGDKVLGTNKYGPFTNDEAFKAAYTDALSNAMKQIGMGADIHMGMFEDEKYVRETAREFANDTTAPHKPGVPGSAGGGSDFRPVGPRNFKAAGPIGTQATKAEAERDGLTTNPPKANASAPATQSAIKRVEWVKKSIEGFKTASTKDELQEWWKAEAARLEVIETAMPTEYERLLVAYDAAIERTAARAA